MAIDNQILKDAIYRLKSKGIIKTQRDVSEKTHYGYTTISDFVNNKQDLSPRFRETFAECYNLDPITLLDRKDKPPPGTHSPPLISTDAMDVYRDKGIIQMQNMVNDMKARIQDLMATIKDQASSINNLSYAEKERSIEAVLKMEHISSLGRSIEVLSNKVHSEGYELGKEGRQAG